ncbi:MAG: TraR/DksA family transcriptional regulator [Paracoccaceae bacterium]|nr:MAG: TraR/DksA family transcriptional regulator [Paracoccaceae bacterium]
MAEMTVHKATMEARLAELSSRLQDIETELDSHHDPDWEDLATQREGDEVLEGLGVSGQAEMRAIRAALARIEAGDYGLCARCGEAIEARRLEILPWVALCRDCAGGRQA